MSTKAIREALDVLSQFIKDAGPCDHSVNICVCGEKRALEAAEAAVEAIERAAKDAAESVEMVLLSDDVSGMSIGTLRRVQAELESIAKEVP